MRRFLLLAALGGPCFALLCACGAGPDSGPAPTDHQTSSLLGTPILVGDANQDGAVTIADALVAQLYVQGQNPAGFMARAADANCDRMVTAADADLIAQAGAGLATLDCPELGDANGDGQLKVDDALIIQGFANGQSPTPFFRSAADVDCDGLVTGRDASLVAEATAGLRTLSCGPAVGDANGDYRLTLADSDTAARYAAYQNPSPVYPSAADANCDRLVTAADATLIQQAVAGSVVLRCPGVGDVNGNGKRDSVDQLMVGQYLLGQSPTPFYPGAADADCDGDIDSQDQVLVSESVVGTADPACTARLGDANGDRRIDTTDSVVVTHYAGGQSPSPLHLVAADADCDGLVASADADLIAQAAVGNVTLKCPAPGDVNGDGAITIVDALRVAQKLQGMNPVPFYRAGADANCDGVVNAKDLDLVNQASVGLARLTCKAYPRLGDVNGDRLISSTDALTVAQFNQGSIPSGFIPAAADVNCDRTLDQSDPQLILEAASGLTTLACSPAPAATLNLQIAAGADSVLGDFESAPEGWATEQPTPATAGFWRTAPGGGMDGTRAIRIYNPNGKGSAAWVRTLTLPAGSWYSIDANIKGSVPSSGKVRLSAGGVESNEYLANLDRNRAFPASGDFDWAVTGLNFYVSSSAPVTLKFELTGPGDVRLDNLRIHRLATITGTHVRLHAEGSDLSGIPPETLSDWLGELSTAWEAFRDLVGGLTPEEEAKMSPMDIVSTRVVDCDAQICAYARAGYPITWGQAYVRAGLEAYVNERDIGFGMLHEISHNFDVNGDKWVWHAEVTSNLKLYFAMLQLQGNLWMDVPGDEPGRYYSASDLRSYYQTVAGQAELTWDHVNYSLIRLTELQGGMQALRDTYAHVIRLPAPLAEDPAARFDYFLQKLDEFSPPNIDVYGIFTPAQIAFVHEDLARQE